MNTSGGDDDYTDIYSDLDELDPKIVALFRQNQVYLTDNQKKVVHHIVKSLPRYINKLQEERHQVFTWNYVPIIYGWNMQLEDVAKLKFGLIIAPGEPTEVVIFTENGSAFGDHTARAHKKYGTFTDYMMFHFDSDGLLNGTCFSRETSGGDTNFQSAFIDLCL